jgi:hypothetical protein
MRLVRRLLGSRWLRVGFAALAVAFLTLAVVRQWDRIGPRLHEVTAATLGVSLLVVLAGLVATMLAWRALLADLGSRLPVAAVWQIFFAGQLGKYVPGSIWPVVMQMELGADHKVPRGRAAAASLVQMGLALATGALISVATVPFVVGRSATDLAWLTAVVVGSAVALHPRVANPVLDVAFRLVRRAPLERPLSWRGLLLASGYQSAGWLLFSVPVILVARDLGGSGARLAVLCVAAFISSWLAGFLFVLAPAGAGVRETLMVALLGTTLTAAPALTVALISRLIMTIADVLVGGIALATIGRDRIVRLRQRRDEAAALELAAAADRQVSGVRARGDQ